MTFITAKAVVLSALISSGLVQAAFDIGFGDDSDLTSFVTRPEIKAPRFVVTEHQPDRVTPGYWFLGPYVTVLQEDQPMHYYQACQTGPHIYDRNGDLVWSGACQFRNQNACDFRAFEANGSTFLSTILYRYGDDKGHGVIMDSSYNTVQNIYAPVVIDDFNMHELNVLDHGKSALHIIYQPKLVDVRILGIPDLEVGWIADIGFREVEVDSGQTKFEWWASDHISISESTSERDFIDGPHPASWNWFHGNSLDKNADGDYIISSRFTNAIYKISGVDGRVLWRLGGINTDFDQDFNFSRQHDARFIAGDSDGTELVSFLDNAADHAAQTSSYTSGLLVRIDTRTTPKTAHVVRRWIRPDEKLSRLRGNFQLLPNGHAIGGWSENSYVSEQSSEGEVLMEARFNSRRFVTYRAYKYNFTGAPSEPPTIKSFVFGTASDSYTTVSYVSWNGATGVQSWKFYGTDAESASPRLIGEAPRTGFETVLQSHGYLHTVYTEAVAADGSVLGTSETFETVITPGSFVNSDASAIPRPHDPRPHRSPTGNYSVAGYAAATEVLNQAFPQLALIEKAESNGFEMNKM